MTYFFLEVLIFFCLTKYVIVNINVNMNFMGNQSGNTIYELVSDIDVEKHDVKLKFMNKF